MSSHYIHLQIGGIHMRTYQNKKQVRDANIYLKKSCKVISVLVVFILLSTVFSSVVSSQSIINSNEEKTDGPLKQLLKNRLAERLALLKEKIKNLRDRLSQLKDKLQDAVKDKTTIKDTDAKTLGTSPRTSFINSVRSLLYTLQASSTLMFYTNYSGIEKRTELRLFREVKVDVNGDNIVDISVMLTLYPKIEKPLALSINFDLTIKRLPDFPNENPPSPPTTGIRSFFQAYVELYFPGLLIAKQKGDIARFGYESAVDQVPENCVVTYKYMPHLLTTKRPEHRLTIDPVKVDSTANKLILLFSYTNMDDQNLTSELVSRVYFDPTVKSTVYIGGEGILGGNTYEFSRELSGPSRVNMTCSFEKNSTTIYGYVVDMPQKIDFSADFGREGFLEFNTSSSASEIGICNNITDPFGVNTSRIYFTDAPTLARLEWNRSLLFEGKANISFYTEGPGASLNGHLALSNNRTMDFKISSKENLYSAMELDLLEGNFTLERSDTDLSVSFSSKGSNKRIIDLSFDIKHTFDSPLVINFGKLFDGEVKVFFATKSVDITSLNATLYRLPSESNNDIFTVKMDEFKRTREGGLNLSFDYYKKDNIITINCTIDITRGIDITGLVIGYNGYLYPIPDVHEEGDAHHNYSFTISDFGVHIWMNENRTEGYISIYGGLSLTFDSSYYNSSDVLVCNVSGTIAFNIEGAEFNISWATVDENRTFNINGSAVASISNFKLWIMDKANISIPQFTGSFELHTYNKTGNLSLFVDKADSSFFVDTNFNITNLFSFTFRSSIYVNLQSAVHGYVEIAWNESGITSINGSGDGYRVGEVTLSDLFFNHENDTVNLTVSADEISVQGDFNFTYNLTVKGAEFNANSATLRISNLEIKKFILGHGGGPDAEFFFSALALKLDIESLYLSAKGFLKVDGGDIQIDSDGSIDLVGLHLVKPEKDRDFVMSFSTDLSLAGSITFDHVTNESFELKLDYGQIEISDFYFNSHENTLVLSFQSIQIQGLFALNFTKTQVTTENVVMGAGMNDEEHQPQTPQDGLNGNLLNVSFSGSGSAIITGLNETSTNLINDGSGYFGVNLSLDLFEIDFDDVHGSMINLSLNISDIVNTTIESIAGEGAISRFIVDNLWVQVNNETLVNLTELKMNFSGTGKFSFAYHDGEISIDGSIAGTGPDIVKIDVLVLALAIAIQNFTISGPTTFHLFAYKESGGDILPADFAVVAGCDSYWKIGELYIAGFLDFIDFEGSGDISLGLGSGDGPTGLNLIVALNGSWNWQNLSILFFTFKVGNFDGNAIIYMDTDILLGAFSFKFNDPTTWLFAFSLLGYSALKITANDYTSIDIVSLGNLLTLGLLNLGPVSLEPGDYSLYWKLLQGDLEWNFRIDTDWKTVSLPLVIFNVLNITGYFRAQDYNVTFDWLGGLGNIKHEEGSIDWMSLQVSICIDGTWYVVLDSGELVADFTWTPLQPGVGQEVQFDGSSSQGEIIRYDWRWDQYGSWDNDIGAYPKHTYSQEGNYKVTLRVWRNWWKRDTQTQTVSVGGGGLNVEIVCFNATMYEGDYFEAHVTDPQNNNAPVTGVTVTYKQWHLAGGSQETTNTTNSDGAAGFFAFDVPDDYYTHYSEAQAYVQTDTQYGESDVFLVQDSAAILRGYVKNNVTYWGIGDALVQAEPGGYSTYTINNWGGYQGFYYLIVPRGTYNITASKGGYESKTFENIDANNGGYINVDILYLPPLGYGGLCGTVYDENGNDAIWCATVTVNGIETHTGVFGNFPDVYPDPVNPYHSIDLLPGTYTLTITDEYYYTNTTQVTIIAGEVNDIRVYLTREWVAPNGYNDPNSGWNDETNAYDDDVSSCASTDKYYNILVWKWTEYLELNCPQTSCDKIRFYAWYNDSYCNKIDVDVYYNGGWHDVYEGPYNNYQWEEKSLSGGSYQVTKARVKFYYKGYIWPWGTTADLHEFDFHKLPPSEPTVT